MKEQPRVQVFDLLKGLKHGQVKCPKCGATDISRADESSPLFCHFCKIEFDPPLVPLDDDAHEIDELKGVHVSTGAQDIAADALDLVTIKCQSCAAEVVINSSETHEARCHWCRNHLSLQNVVPNGAVPDLVLPFTLSKAMARAALESYMDEYKYFAHPRFKREFNAENTFALYLPYMLVDIKAHSRLEGQGESTLSKSHQTTGSGSTQKTTTTYEVGTYQISREFDLLVDDLLMQSKHDRLHHRGTAHVINAVLPFDTKRAVKWNPSLLKGMRSEKRDLNVSGLEKSVFTQLYDIGFMHAATMIEPYDRGVKWSSHKQDVLGEKWVSIYLPVWIYSYKSWPWGKVYYSAMNARSGKVVGTMPINYPKLLFICALFLIIPLLLAHYVMLHFAVLMILAPWIFISTYRDYHKSGVRHRHAEETRTRVSEVQREDILLKKGQSDSPYSMNGAQVYPPKKS